MLIGNIEIASPLMLTAVVHEGVQAKHKDGRPAYLAVVDENGNVLDSGEHLGRAVYVAAVQSFKNLLQGQGHLRVHQAPREA